MAVKEIITNPAKILRRNAHKVKNFDHSLQNLIEDMVDTMRNEPGVGLAAPQINVPLQVIVVEYADNENSDLPPKLYAVVNPVISRFSAETEIGIEGCLSIPGYVGEVERAVKVIVKGQDKYGNNIRIKTDGWLARIFQHEIDHLNGILFVDRAAKVWSAEKEDETSAIAV